MAVEYRTGSFGPAYFTDVPGRFRLSWGAILAGVAVALVTLLALNLLGLSIGLGVLKPAEEGRYAAVGIGAGIWMVISTIISLFIGGWVSARMSGIPDARKGILHGIVMWSIVTLLTFYLMSTAIGGLFSGAASVIGKGISATAITTVGGAPEEILSEARQLLARPGATAGGEDISVALNRLFAGGGQASDREAVVNILVTRAGMSREEASGRVDSWVTRYQQIVPPGTTPADIAQSVTNALSAAALWGFIAMVLGAAAAGFGGWLGAPKELEAPAGAPTTEARA